MVSVYSTMLRYLRETTGRAFVTFSESECVIQPLCTWLEIILATAESLFPQVCSGYDVTREEIGLLFYLAATQLNLRLQRQSVYTDTRIRRTSSLSPTKYKYTDFNVRINF